MTVWRGDGKSWCNPPLRPPQAAAWTRWHFRFLSHLPDLGLLLRRGPVVFGARICEQRCVNTGFGNEGRPPDSRIRKGSFDCSAWFVGARFLHSKRETSGLFMASSSFEKFCGYASSLEDCQVQCGWSRSLAFSKNDQLQKDPFSGSARKYHQYLLVEIVLKNDNHF